MANGRTKFLKSLYLGDRYCKGIEIDSFAGEIKIRINRISRILDGATSWNYYTDQDIENGSIVFKGIRSFYWDSVLGGLPNESVYLIDVVEETDALATVKIVIGSIDDDANASEVVIKFSFEECYLEDANYKKFY